MAKIFIPEAEYKKMLANGEEIPKATGEPTDKSLPSTTTQIKNVFGAVVNYVVSGFQNTTKDEYEERLQICEHCEFRTENWRCTECGCFIESKAHMKSEECPKEKWPKLSLSVINQGCNSCGEKKSG